MVPTPDTQQVRRITPAEVRQKLKSGRRVYLVCAYDDEEKCRQLRLDDALTLGEFQRRFDTINPDDELVFYCA